MATLADEVHARIQALERDALGLKNGVIQAEIELTPAEIQAYCAAFGGNPETLDSAGVVRIVNTARGRAKGPTLPGRKFVNIQDDVNRHRVACQLAQKAGLPEPAMPENVRRHLESKVKQNAKKVAENQKKRKASAGKSR